MKKWVLLILCSLMVQNAFAQGVPSRTETGHIMFGDGRVCKSCTAYYTPNGFLVSVRDKNGTEWLTEPGQQVTIDNHPYLKEFRRRLSNGAQGYAQAAQMQQYRPVRNWNCNTIGNSSSCYGY